MRKKFTILLILVFVFGLTPVNFSFAITQNQINAEVQIVCPDNYGNWFSGSGTIIDSKGIILTNKHVVTDEKGGIIKACFIGFVESINVEPNFGTESNPNIAEVKYYTSTNDMDAAILYLDNKSNKAYPYVDIWNSDSNKLVFGDRLEVIGFPGIGGSTVTYTSGDFSGFGSKGDGFQNYIKTTAPLEHGNSGGASYNPSTKFIGIPTMVVRGTLNSLSYILSVNSIKSWLSGILGNNYQQEVIEQKPVIEAPKVTMQNDVTPPNFNNIDSLCYNIFDNDLVTGARCFPKKLGKVEGFDNLQFIIYKSDMAEIDSGGLNKTYYYFDKKPHNELDSNAKEHLVTDYQDRLTISDKITISEPGKYYFSFFAVDNNNNISNSIIYEYVYEPESFKLLQTVNFYKDLNKKNFISSYDVNNNPGYVPTSLYKSFFGAWGYGANVCYTNQNNLTLEWVYPKDYESYVVYTTNSYNNFPFQTTGKIIGDNKYTLNNLSLGKKINYKEFIHDNMDERGILYEIYLKPYLSDNKLEHKHRLLLIVYESTWGSELDCSWSPTFTKSNRTPVVVDINLADRLKGKILLQVESHGEAYYVYPKDSKRYYMADGNEAYRVMRYLGIGITNQDLEKIKVDKNLAKKSSGKIFLQVEAHGEAYYIDFNGIAHYLKDGSAAYTIMRELGLGITNSDLNKIGVGEIK